MKKIYISPEITVLVFSVSDIIEASGIPLADTNSASYSAVEFSQLDGTNYGMWHH